jgi:hypothetical protein
LENFHENISLTMRFYSNLLLMAKKMFFIDWNKLFHVCACQNLKKRKKKYWLIEYIKNKNHFLLLSRASSNPFNGNQLFSKLFLNYAWSKSTLIIIHYFMFLQIVWKIIHIKTSRHFIACNLCKEPQGYPCDFHPQTLCEKIHTKCLECYYIFWIMSQWDKWGFF